MTKRQATVIFALSTISLVLALLISRRFWFRIDLTENKAHTISAVSRNLYAEIPDQVRITYYVSDKLTSIHPLPGEITDLLTEYAAYSRGKIRLNVRDPVKANMVSIVENLGIQPQQIQTVEQDQASVSTVYTGIVIEYLDQAETLPVVFSLDTLEYDLTSRIRGLIRGTAREAGVIVGDAARQWERDYNYLNQALVGAGFKVRVITPGDEIGEVVSVLFVLGGAEEMDQTALSAINRYIQGGGKALFAVEGVTVDTGYSLSARPVNDLGLLSMIASYGAVIKPELVLDQSALTLPYSVPGAGGSSQIRIVRYPHWIGALRENANPSHPISASFGGADLFWPSPLELAPPAGVEGTVLFTSTPEAWLMTKDFSIDPSAGYLFTQEEAETRGAKIFAVALTGTFPAWEGAGKESRIVVVGDTDLIYSPNVEYTRSSRNMDFFIQAADWLSNDDDIIGIRGRQSQTGRLDRIVDEERRIKAMAFARLFNVVFLPLAVLAAGGLMALKRRRSLKNGGGSDDV
ncbi:MAG: GldG family protein [Treponema sp.]|jgi:ABC-type uncharacterized transport system involved in gliding motility auxiliary subunit|nr:GldG family protein [Treponema sp.]